MTDRKGRDRWRRALGATVDRTWARSRSMAFVAVYAAWVAFCVVRDDQSGPGRGTVGTASLPVHPCAEASHGARAARG